MHPGSRFDREDTPKPGPALDFDPLDFYPLDLATRILADRWSLLIVRELMIASCGFNALARALPALSRTLLSSRLKYLASIRVLERSPAEHARGQRDYRLTPAGLALRPLLDAYGIWARDWGPMISGEEPHAIARILQHMSDNLNFEQLPANDLTIGFEFLDSDAPLGWIRARAGNPVAAIGPHEVDLDLRVTVAPRILHELWWGYRQCEDARLRGDIGFDGPTRYSLSFSSWFTAERGRHLRAV
ncbi:winged helix-turn-helix transcriptional regulator [Gulosibacter molinativorax]|uniref:HTH hxlR-type domain-containing protein n=1 Tax=Gulosibacter molinativorax TaxID=256821 RepID=A0ABT7C5V2_9MICO|nr:winged helix-turn-helix transcriptional regulator [Gulosibacter molinativorax]MDJ1370051.1 hypothetical protein [Gulosibacter molinativorax]QUY63758.1 Hypothetical protein GMOLON4_3085 [Gulosibacter molinativorax]